MIGLAILGSLLAGILIAVVGMFCWKLLQGMNHIQATADRVAQMVDRAEKIFGEASPLARASRSVTKLTDNLPEVLAGLKVFNETFSKIAQATFTPEVFKETPQVSPDREGEAGESAFIPYSEEQAAQFEVTRRAQSERLVLSPDELAMMRTDKVVETPTPTPES